MLQERYVRLPRLYQCCVVVYACLSKFFARFPLSSCSMSIWSYIYYFLDSSRSSSFIFTITVIITLLHPRLYITTVGYYRFFSLYPSIVSYKPVTMLIRRILLSVAIGLGPGFASAHVAHANEGFLGMHGGVAVEHQHPLQSSLREPMNADDSLSQPAKREVDGRCGPQLGSCAEGSCCSVIGKISQT